MRKLFMIIASVALMAPAFALDTPPVLATNTTFTLAVQNATIPTYAVILQNIVNPTIDLGAPKDTDVKWSTPATIQVEANIDLSASLHFGGPLLNQGTGRYGGDALETGLWLSYTGVFKSPLGEWGTPTSVDTHALTAVASPDPLQVDQAFQIRHGSETASGADQGGATMNAKLYVTRHGLADAAGTYNQSKDPTTITLSYID